MAEWIKLPEKVKRGKKVPSKPRTGWILVNPGQTLGFKATQVAYFGGPDQEPYITFKIVWPKSSN
jgi:hypothetical protein